MNAKDVLKRVREQLSKNTKFLTSEKYYETDKKGRSLLGNAGKIELKLIETLS